MQKNQKTTSLKLSGITIDTISFITSSYKKNEVINVLTIEFESGINSSRTQIILTKSEIDSLIESLNEFKRNAELSDSELIANELEAA